MNIKNKLKMVKMSDINPYSKNAKKHPKWQIELIAESLKNNDYYSPIGIDKANEIVIGHGRFEAMQMMKGIDDLVEVVDFTYLSPSKIKKLRIMDNKIVSDEWDKELLEAELKEILEASGGDLESLANDIGITEKEMNEIMPLSMDDTNGDDEIPDNAPAITKEGDLWELGDHRLLCGDSTKEEDVNKLMNGKKADMVFTDPPYGVSYQSNMRTKTEKFEVIKNDEHIITEWIPLAKKYNNGFSFIWTSWKVCDIWMELLDDISNMIIWNKGGGGLGDLNRTFSTDYEIALVSHNGNNILGKRIGSVWNIGKDSASSYLHPTQKPVALPIMAIENVTLLNHKVLDLFLGSGSTLIACEKTTRKCYGMELDLKYCDVIIKRYHDFCLSNNKTPVIKRNGEIFTYEPIAEG